MVPNMFGNLGSLSDNSRMGDIKICNDRQRAQHLVQQVKATVIHTMMHQMDFSPKFTGFISHIRKN